MDHPLATDARTRHTHRIRANWQSVSLAVGVVGTFPDASLADDFVCLPQHISGGVQVDGEDWIASEGANAVAPVGINW